jgi:hypothetical protein
MARGDHIYVYRFGYSHHGIDLGNGEVIHFDYDPDRWLTGKLSPARPPAVRQVARHEFAQDRPIIVRRYPAPDDPELVVDRAQSRLGESGYDLFFNNCEHFAVWCKTGRARSTQVEDFIDATVPLGAALPTAAVLLRAARRFPGRLRTAAYGATFALTAGAFAQRYIENRWRRAVRRES